MLENDHNKFLKAKILFVFALLVPFIYWSQSEILMENQGYSESCGAIFKDPGGNANYSGPQGNQEIIVHTICNPNQGPFWLVFDAFELFANGCGIGGETKDILKIYDGSSTSGELIGEFTGTDLQPGIYTASFASESGCFTFEFIRNQEDMTFACDANNGAPGWEAQVTCIPPPIPETGGNCFEAYPFCSSDEYEFPNATEGVAPEGPDYGCLGSQPRPIWYFMKIGETGNIELDLRQTSVSGGGIDIDFAMWGPFNNLIVGCNEVMSGNVSPLQCSFSTSSTETIGLGVEGGYGSGESTPDTPQEGQYYIVVMTNYNGSTGTISLNQTNGTGATDCSVIVICAMDDLTATPTPCDENTNKFSVSGQVSFTDPPEDGQLVVIDCNGNSVSFQPPFVSPINYTITDISSDGQNCGVTAYFTSKSQCNITKNYQNPARCVCDVPDVTIDVVKLCNNDSVDLNEGISTSSNNGVFLFYITEQDALNATNEINSVVSVAGNYWVRVEEDGYPDCYEVYEIDVVDGPIVDNILITDPSCNGFCDAELEVEYSGGNAPYAITWQDADGVTIGNTDQIGNLCAGVYTVQIEDVNECIIQQEEIEIESPTSDSFELDKENPTCGNQDGKIIISGIPVNNNYNVNYNFNANPFSKVLTSDASGSIVIDNLAQGVYEDIEVAAINGCAYENDSKITLIEPLPPIVVAKGDTSICEGQQAILYVDNPRNAIISWDKNIIDGQFFSPDFVGEETYTVTATIDNCVATDQAVVRVVETPAPEFLGDNLLGCKPHVVSFENNYIPPSGSTCTWDFGDGQIGTACGAVIHTYLYSGIYNVSLTIETAEGCVGTTSINDYVEVIHGPVAAFSMIPETPSINEPNVKFLNDSKYGNFYEWDFGDESPIENEENVEHTYSDEEAKNYVVTLVVTNDIGCIDSVQAVVRIIDDLVFYVPNSFTPDGDNYNDVFQPIFTSGFDRHDYKLTIYNRWGEVVFETQDADEGWDGTYKGQLVKGGTYVWKIEFKELMSDQHHSTIGNLNVLR